MRKPRKPTGGYRPGAGRKPDAIPTKAVQVWLTPYQHDMLRALGGSPWLQGQLNLNLKIKAAENV